MGIGGTRVQAKPDTDWPRSPACHIGSAACPSFKQAVLREIDQQVMGGLVTDPVAPRELSGAGESITGLVHAREDALPELGLDSRDA